MSGCFRIAPGLLSADFARLGVEVARVAEAEADLFHRDVIDGHYVPNLNFRQPGFRVVRERTRTQLDVHLMVEPVDALAPRFAKAHADIIAVHPCRRD